MKWRQGSKIPHHLYRQRGDEPDTRPFPIGDRPVATFIDPDDARWTVEAAAIVAELARDQCCEQWGEPGDRTCPEFVAGPGDGWCPMCRARALVAGPPAEYRHDDCATCGTKADPVILQHPAGYTLAEQVQAVWDEEGPDGIADAIRRVARGEGSARVSVPSDSLLAVEIAARNLFRAICHEYDERGETFPVRVSLCMNGLREALGEEYPPMTREAT